MQPLTNCGENLVVLIETPEQDWTWIYDIVKTTSIRISNSPHRHPIPYGTEITDHIRRNMDEITITGVIGCIRCDATFNDFKFRIPQIKKLADRMIYTPDDFVTLTSNHWMARYMILIDANIQESQDSVQTKLITTTWLGANLTGTIRNPDFKRGGIVY